MTPALLDVNILVALFDAEHPHHDLAHDWFEDNRAAGWATCPLTENAVVRVMSRPAYHPLGIRATTLLENLRTFCRSDDHQFWPDAVSLTDSKLFNPALISGPRQLTDIYLLGLARKMGGCLATFDQHIPMKAVIGATPDMLQVIAPGE